MIMTERCALSNHSKHGEDKDNREWNGNENRRHGGGQIAQRGLILPLVFGAEADCTISPLL